MGGVRRRAAAGLLALGALVLGLTGVATSAAAAPTNALVSVHVQSAQGAPLRGVFVVGERTSDGRTAYLGTTDRNGDLVDAAGLKGRTQPGDYQLGFVDQNTARTEAGTLMAPLTTTVAIRPGRNRLRTVTMRPGETIRGTVTAPSGAPIRDYYLFAVPTEHTDVVGGFSEGFAESDADGHYVVSGLLPGGYRLLTDPEEPSVPLTVPVGGVVHDVTDVVSRADQVDLTGRTTSRGVVTLTYTVGSFQYAGTDPGGTVSIVVDGDRTHPVVAAVGPGEAGARAVVPVGGLAAGNHTFVASYAGPDLVAARVGLTKTVR